MNRPAWIPPSPAGSLLLIVLTLAGFGLGARSAGAQQTEAEVNLAALELEYEAAMQSYAAALAARRVVESEWRAALDSVTAARASGERALLDQASAEFLARTSEFDRLDERVRDAQLRLTAQRERLLEALEQRSTELVEEADAESSAARRAELFTRVRDLQLQFGEVFRQAEGSLDPTPVFYPGSLAYNPRDTPDLLRAKTQLIERRIEAVSTQIDEASERIDDLERQIRLRRQQENFNAPLDRFGDVQLPVVTGSTEAADASEALSDSLGARPPSLDEQLEHWRLQERQLTLLLEQLRANLQQFHERLGIVSGVTS